MSGSGRFFFSVATFVSTALSTIVVKAAVFESCHVNVSAPEAFHVNVICLDVVSNPSDGDTALTTSGAAVQRDIFR